MEFDEFQTNGVSNVSYNYFYGLSSVAVAILTLGSGLPANTSWSFTFNGSAETLTNTSYKYYDKFSLCPEHLI